MLAYITNISLCEAFVTLMDQDLLTYSLLSSLDLLLPGKGKRSFLVTSTLDLCTHDNMRHIYFSNEPHEISCGYSSSHYGIATKLLPFRILGDLVLV